MFAQNSRTPHLWRCVAMLALATPSAEVTAQVASDGRRQPATNVAPLVADSLYGRSGKLQVSRPLAIPVLERLFGDDIRAIPGIYNVSDSAGKRPFSIISLLPFSQKQGAKVGSYRMGFWPAERRTVQSAAYENPDGFIAVYPENLDMKVSEHFTLRDFITRDQPDVWPKYLVLREELLDKLELVIEELKRSGVPVRNVRVTSGFRTPQHNSKGIGRSGQATDSRHLYGDAADIMIDNDGNGRMDDLNGDKRVNYKDVKVILDAVDRVEKAYPELVGGVGLYRATRQHGPFAHIDVRGKRVRWVRS
jgi:uncharacterized protein YcbK (DUF882 family)